MYMMNILKMDLRFSFLGKGIILWIELPWPENPAKHLHMTYGNTGELFQLY